MKTTTLSDFKRNFKMYFDRITKNSEALTINLRKDSGIVVMSLQEYKSLISKCRFH
ncbi:type II toxin-antitoxin system Phd/YefM family antitoxin [Psychroflexus sp. CAK1W]|uniref:type II toxin-antitoxin system Phd/YefM family antitoxin n=1 Tax=Psychroflexus curvus TaxID=2873595 RepID=UPI001CC9079F|nr:type II toxin-antitoxin system Phd/YefM family antitoxin [Psychroflexus curvus]MBZ9628879.1 type II toxin-antitoxin system Phd/YefM family antitoxin [Psychroflexus curvus]